MVVRAEKGGVKWSIFSHRYAAFLRCIGSWSYTVFVAPSPQNMRCRVSADQTLNGAFGGIECHPALDAAVSFEAVSGLLKVYGLLIQGSPKALDEGVAQISTAAIHRDSHGHFR